MRSNFLSDKIFEGTVTRIVGEADLQRNTLQVKVRFHDTDHRLRPDMLCRAEFLATAASGEAGSLRPGETNVSRVAVYVPLAALVDRDKETASVWTVDRDGKLAEKRSVRIGNEERDGHILVTEGMRPGDRAILNPPQDLLVGERIRFNSNPDLR